VEIISLTGEKREVWTSFTRGGYATWQPGQDCEIHSHQDAGEFFVILSGACEFAFDAATTVLEAGSAVYVGPDEKHKLRVVGDGPMTMFLAVFPNHQPTHTFYHADGTPYYRNRLPPTESD
jgi:quercetin dioxygenase-like cupin family protein